jgi:inosine/xanthosine triphosphatase
MEKIVVAVGSTRRPKISAVEEALDSISRTFQNKLSFETVGVDVPSGVRHTPLTREDLMAGARQRAEALVKIAAEKAEPWKYFVGLEGGFDVIAGLDAIPDLNIFPDLDIVREAERRWVFLQSWAYVTDSSGRGAYGQSGAILVPEQLARTVVDDGVELSEAIDTFAGKENIRDREGAWGILTGNLISRQESFRVAGINAFAPFFNQVYLLQDSRARA